MSSPSALIKVNYLVMRYLHFGSVRGDLQEGNVYDKRLRGYAFRYQFPPFQVPIPILPSTKSAFLCFFGLRNPHFRAFRAQNRGSCALFGFGTLVFGLFEHKIEVFVLGRAFVFWEWWVLSCILTFVVCLSNFYELFLLKLP